MRGINICIKSQEATLTDLKLGSALSFSRQFWTSSIWNYKPKKGAHDSDSGIINFDMIHDSKRTHFDMYLELGEAHFDIGNNLKLSLFDTLMIRNSALLYEPWFKNSPL